MIKIKTLTVQNFMSVGNQTQAIDFDRGQLTLVLGENLDLGGDDGGSRNGTGKTTIVNGLSYAIYGGALTNIKKDNLINKINSKNMLVTCTFEKDGVEYHIERGRKPNLLRFKVNGHEQVPDDTDESQGDSRETQKSIEEVFGMSHTMFKHLVALNTYTEPFLAMRSNDQRDIIEQLLGITMLSEKAEKLKEQNRFIKDEIKTATAKIEAIKNSNDKILQSIESLERKQKLWNENKEQDLKDIETAIEKLAHIDIEKEVESQRMFSEWQELKKERGNIESLIARQSSSLDRSQRQLDKLESELVQLKEKTCHTCGQELHDNSHLDLIERKESQIKEISDQINIDSVEIKDLNEALNELGELGNCPKVEYNNLEEALNHKSTLEALQKEWESKHVSSNPYDEQIKDLRETAIQEISWDSVNELTRIKDHQEFLLKLLTNKDSFLRKKIIDQNLAFLNQRLTHYLSRVGLPHIVEFQNDLSVIITQLGQDLDFDNLSRGERNRLILSMSWAFRDVWENLYHGINLLFIDELIDNGLDASGVESSISVLKKMTRERDKNVFLISHKDDLTNRVNQVLKVIKENGFTSYNTDVDIV